MMLEMFLRAAARTDMLYNEQGKRINPLGGPCMFAK
jgi:hypothetical protein